MQEFNKSAKRCVSGLRFIFHRSEETEPKKQNPSTMERSFTELRFASFPALDCEDPGRLSRVQMNALRAPLTVSPELKEDMCSFSLDRADDFIDGIYPGDEGRDHSRVLCGATRHFVGYLRKNE